MNSSPSFLAEKPGGNYLNKKNLHSVMNRNNSIRFVVNKEEKEQIKLRAKVNGYNSISSYLRAVAINNDFLIKFNQIYSRLIEDEAKRNKSS